MNRRNLCSTIGICAIAGCLRQQDQTDSEPDTTTDTAESDNDTPTDTAEGDNDTPTESTDQDPEEFPIELQETWQLPSDMRNVTGAAGDIFIQTHSTTFDRYTTDGEQIFRFDGLEEGYRADVVETGRNNFFADESGVYLGTRHTSHEDGGTLYAIDSVTGNSRWKISIEYGGVHAITRSDGQLIYSATDPEDNTTYIEARNVESGEKLWDLTGLEDRVPNLLPYNDMLIIQRATGIEAINIETKETIFEENVIPGFLPAGLHSGALYFQFEGDERLRSLSLPSGDERWSVGIENSPSTPPSFGEEGVFYGTSAGHILARDQDTGEKLWDNRIDSGIDHELIIADGVVWIGSERGTLVGLNAATGEYLYREQFPEAFTFAVIGDTLVTQNSASAFTIQNSQVIHE